MNSQERKNTWRPISYTGLIFKTAIQSRCEYTCSSSKGWIVWKVVKQYFLLADRKNNHKINRTRRSDNSTLALRTNFTTRLFITYFSLFGFLFEMLIFDTNVHYVSKIYISSMAKGSFEKRRYLFQITMIKNVSNTTIFQLKLLLFIQILSKK